MSNIVDRESCSHTPLEILRQDALDGNWGAAKRICCQLELRNSTGRADLELVFAVWAGNPGAVAAAISEIEAKDTNSGLAL
jgi:hypothetical protein